MRALPVVEAKARFSALLDAVEAGEEVAITRHGRVVARVVPPTARMAADLFREVWDEGGIELREPPDPPPAPVRPLD